MRETRAGTENTEQTMNNTLPNRSTKSDHTSDKHRCVQTPYRSRARPAAPLSDKQIAERGAPALLRPRRRRHASRRTPATITPYSDPGPPGESKGETARPARLGGRRAAKTALLSFTLVLKQGAGRGGSEQQSLQQGVLKGRALQKFSQTRTLGGSPRAPATPSPLQRQPHWAAALPQR